MLHLLKRRYTALAAPLILLFFLAGLTYGAAVPALKGRVNDYAGILSAQTEEAIDAQLAALEQSDSTQIAVLTVNSLEGDSVEQYSMAVVEKWKLGQQGFDNGALLLIAKDDRKIRIEVGYGLEGKLTDLMAGRIIDSIISPAFRQGDFNGGTQRAVSAMVGAVKGEFTAADLKPKNQGSAYPDLGAVLMGFFFFVFVILRQLASRSRVLSTVMGAAAFPLLGVMLGFGTLGLILMAIFGAFIGLAISMLPVPTHSDRGSGPWINTGGGGYHRGGLGGGGLGGGFGGGGGGFGGGGASGGW